MEQSSGQKIDVSSVDRRAVIEDFFSSERKQTTSGETIDVGLACSVSRDDALFLYDVLRKLKPSNALEIGLAWGGSAVAISSALLDNERGHHTAIDPFAIQTWSGVALSEMKRLALDSRFTFLEERSDAVLPRFLVEDRKFDFIFIDGDHRFDGVFVDYYYSQMLLEIGGLMVFDDSNSDAIGRVISFAKNNLKNLEFRGIQRGRFGIFEKTKEDTRSPSDIFPF